MVGHQFSSFLSPEYPKLKILYEAYGVIDSKKNWLHLFNFQFDPKENLVKENGERTQFERLLGKDVWSLVKTVWKLWRPWRPRRKQ